VTACYVVLRSIEVCAIFRTLPTRDELPDYYKMIKKPIDVDLIRKYECK
jgi:hypothetical protein